MKFRLLIPLTHEELMHLDDVQAVPVPGVNTPSVVVSAGYLGRCKSVILDSRELGNYMDRFRNDPAADPRFYVERIDEDNLDSREQRRQTNNTLMALKEKLFSGEAPDPYED